MAEEDNKEYSFSYNDLTNNNDLENQDKNPDKPENSGDQTMAKVSDRIGKLYSPLTAMESDVEDLTKQHFDDNSGTEEQKNDSEQPAKPRYGDARLATYNDNSTPFKQVTEDSWLATQKKKSLQSETLDKPTLLKQANLKAEPTNPEELLRQVVQDHFMDESDLPTQPNSNSLTSSDFNNLNSSKEKLLNKMNQNAENQNTESEQQYPIIKDGIIYEKEDLEKLGYKTSDDQENVNNNDYSDDESIGDTIAKISEIMSNSENPEQPNTTNNAETTESESPETSSWSDVIEEYVVSSAGVYELAQKIDIAKGHDKVDIIVQVATEISHEIMKHLNNPKQNILMVVGTGSAGMNATLAAYVMKQKGYHIHIMMIDDMAQYNEFHQERLKTSDNVFLMDTDVRLSDYHIVIDAIEGIGNNTKLSADVVKLIEKINERNNLTVLSVGTPSGICMESGNIETVAVKSDYTISFKHKWQPHVINQASTSYMGQVICCDVDLSNVIEISDLEFLTLNHVNLWQNKIVNPMANFSIYNKEKIITIGGFNMGREVQQLNTISRIASGSVETVVSQLPSLNYKIDEMIDIRAIAKDVRDVWHSLLSTQTYSVISIGSSLGFNDSVNSIGGALFDALKDKESNVVISGDLIQYIIENKSMVVEYLNKSELEVTLLITNQDLSDLLPEHEDVKNPLQKLKILAQELKVNLVMHGNMLIVCDKNGDVVVNHNLAPINIRKNYLPVLSGLISSVVGYNVWLSPDATMLQRLSIATYVYNVVLHKVDIFGNSSQIINAITPTLREVIKYK